MSKRVRRVAQRIIESSGLGRMKSGGEISTIEQNVPNWGGGAEAHVGDILMADGSMDHKEGKDVEWEVSFHHPLGLSAEAAADILRRST